MKLPKKISEEEFLRIFNLVISKLAKKFVFSFRDEDDIRQEGFLLAVEGLERYDGKRPLANFLYIHIRNRLCNFKRKHYIRIEPPCTRCPFHAFIPPDGCKKFVDMMDCDLYARWHKRNIVKRNLSHTLEYGQVKHSGDDEDNMKYSDRAEDNLDKKEIFAIIDKHLPVNLRKSYLIMLNNGKVGKKEEEAVKLEIINILEKEGYKL